MKLFGGGGAHSTRGTHPKTEASDSAGLSKKKKIIIVVAVILAVILGAAAFAMANIKAPSLKKPGTGNTAASSGEEPELPLNLDLGDHADKRYTFLVCATDQDDLHTDNIMLVSFDTSTHEVNVLNIPRDTMSSCSRTGASKKINAAYMIGGIEATMKDVTKVIGFEPDFYIVMSFQGIADMVNAIGGVTYDVPFRMYYTDPVQNLKIDFQPGEQKMNGDQVVEFLRWRKNNSGYRKYQPAEYDGSDESRIKKQQEFLTFVGKEVLNSANIGNAMSLAQAVFNNIKTDLSWGEMLWLVKEAYSVNFSSDLHMMTLPGYADYSYAGTGTPYSFYFPNESETIEIINTYFNPYANPITNIDVISSPPQTYRPSGGSTSEPDEEPVIEDPVVTPEPGYEVDENGDPILDENGDPIPTDPGEGGEAGSGELTDPNTPIDPNTPVDPETPAEPGQEPTDPSGSGETTEPTQPADPGLAEPTPPDNTGTVVEIPTDAAA